MLLAGVVTGHAVLVLLLFVFSAPPTCRATHNVTAILAAHRGLSEFSRLLTATDLADDIDGRNTITVLAVDDAGMAQLRARGLPRETLRHVLSLHVLVDYYDDGKLHRLPGGAAVVSTLFQASGDAPGSAGMLKIADRRGGRVAFVPQDVGDASAAVFYVKSLHEAPYNISVLQVSGVISSPAAEAPSSPQQSRPNATDVMSKNGCGRFARHLATTADAAAAFEKSAVAGGLTIFCPSDEALAAFSPAFKNLTAGDRLKLLLYHGVPRHYSLTALKADNNGDMNTLATGGSGGYNFTVRTIGETVELLSAVRKAARVAGTLMDADPLAVHMIDAVLVPRELFKGSLALRAADGADEPPEDVTGGVRDQKKNGASSVAPCRLSFALASLLAIVQMALV